jgi:cell division protein FtsL
MEDYVYEFLHNRSVRKSQQAFAFFGEIRFVGIEKKVLIRGAVELDQMEFQKGVPVFTDAVWDEIYHLAKEFFPRDSIVGWALQGDDVRELTLSQIARVCQRHFPGDYGNVLLYEANTGWEELYLPGAQEMQKAEGFLVYYAANGSMSSYLSSYYATHKQVIVSKSTSSETHAEKRWHREWTGSWPKETDQEMEKEPMDAALEAENVARYRAYLKEAQTPHRRLNRVAVSLGLVAVLLLSGILVQNYTSLMDMQEAVETLREQRQEESDTGEDGSDTVISDNITKEAEDLPKVDENGDDAATETGSISETGDPDVTGNADENGNSDETDGTADGGGEENSGGTVSSNVYLQQGYYIVEKGDKLIDISRKIYGTDDQVSAICAYNNIVDMDRICAGDKLLLP